MISVLHTNCVGDMAGKAARLMFERAQIEQARQSVRSPLVQQGNDVFERAMRRGLGHYQSRDLKKLLRELRQFQAKPDVVNTLRTQRALARWVDHHPMEVCRRTRDAGDHLEALRRAVDARRLLQTLVPGHRAMAAGCANPVLAHRADVKGWDRLCPGQTLEALQQALPHYHRKQKLALLVHRASGDLRARSSYVLVDAPVLPRGTPARRAIQKYRRKVLQVSGSACSAYDAHLIARQLTSVNNNQAPDGQALATMRHLMDCSRAATSLSMACSTAASLLEHNTDGLRVELIASRDPNEDDAWLEEMHVTYKVVLGRPRGSQMDDPVTWGPEVRVLGRWKGVAPEAQGMGPHTSLLDTCAQLEVPDAPFVNNAAQRDAALRAALDEFGPAPTPAPSCSSF